MSSAICVSDTSILILLHAKVGQLFLGHVNAFQNSIFLYCTVTCCLTDSLPEDGRIQPDQLKDLNYLECVIKVGLLQSV